MKMRVEVVNSEEERTHRAFRIRSGGAGDDMNEWRNCRQDNSRDMFGDDIY